MSSLDRNELLTQLCPGDLSESWHKHLKRVRIPGSGQWFLDDPKIEEWLDTQHPPLLWLHGPSATGKTFLCSRLAEYVQETQDTKGNAAAFVEFQQNHVQNNLADFNYAFTSVLRQLVSQLSSTSGVLGKLAKMDDIPYPDDDEFHQLLRLVASEFGKVFIVFDGVNSITAAALEALIQAMAPSGSDPSLWVLLASRNAPPAELSASDQILDIPLRAHDSDVKMYITQTLHDIPAKGLTSRHQELIQDLVEVFDGRFLPIPAWPVGTPAPEFLASLDRLFSSAKSASASDKTDAFCKEVAMQIIDSQWANMVFCTLYHVIRASEAGYVFTMPMALQALDAWQIKRGGSDFTAAEVVAGCRGPIYYGEDDEAMRITSPLLGNYLKRSIFTVEYEKQSVTAFMRYLSSDTFAQGACTSSAALKERLHQNRYLWYAARMLSPSLATTTPDTFVDDFIHLSSRRGSIESYLQAAEAWPYQSEASYDECEQDQERWECFSTGYGPLHLAAHLAAPKLLIDTLVARGEDVEAQDNDGRTALHLAAEIDGENPTLQALIEAGSFVQAEDHLGNTPLSNAVVNSSLDSVKTLLSHGADTSALDEETLEQCAQEKPEIAAYLRELGIDVPEEDESDEED
ncbi:hypothetical protein FLONG3_8489 [Fusarium longipes]|uniref:Nephrocystin 3-like N-terminal domain-containing protein n=1 Tax=Fusarium longipes TaxID=694270 RepID=A0A395S515_9HYPO|nr:hypothetical protein FLONG3_8489 [Fusarium longipes]